MSVLLISNIKILTPMFIINSYATLNANTFFWECR